VPKKIDVGETNWEEIFDTVNYDYLPIEYVGTIIVTFLDGKVWEVDLHNKNNVDDPADTIATFLDEYNEKIDTVDFRLDTDRIKKDITKRTKRFLKLNK